MLYLPEVLIINLNMLESIDFNQIKIMDYPRAFSLILIFVPSLVIKSLLSMEAIIVFSSMMGFRSIGSSKSPVIRRNVKQSGSSVVQGKMFLVTIISKNQ